MTEARPAPLAPVRTAAAKLRDLVARRPLAFMLVWIAGLAALAPLSLLAGTAPPAGLWDVDLSFDKILHVVAYGGLAGIPMLALPARRGRLLSVGLVLLFSVGYEIGQGYVPGRSFGYGDLLANLAGVTLGALAGSWMRRLPSGAG